VAGGLTTEIGDLPLHPDDPDPDFQEARDALGQLPDAQYGRLVISHLFLDLLLGG